MQASSLRKGMFVKFNDALQVVVDSFHGTPGKGRAFVQLKTRDLLNGKIVTTKFSSNEDVETIFLESRSVQYLYNDQDGFHFMDMEDYNSFCLKDDAVGDDKFFLVENMELEVLFYGENPVKLKIPRQLILVVAESEPGVKGDSVSNNSKPAVLETGLRIQVPLFINEGDKIKIDTEEAKYMSRES